MNNLKETFLQDLSIHIENLDRQVRAIEQRAQQGRVATHERYKAARQKLIELRDDMREKLEQARGISGDAWSAAKSDLSHVWEEIQAASRDLAAVFSKEDWKI